MGQLKYVNFENVGLVIFQATMSHRDMVGLIGDTPVSAGFVFADELNPPSCTGRSTSLGLKACHQDTETLRRKLGFESP